MAVIRSTRTSEHEAPTLTLTKSEAKAQTKRWSKDAPAEFRMSGEILRELSGVRNDAGRLTPVARRARVELKLRKKTRGFAPEAIKAAVKAAAVASVKG